MIPKWLDPQHNRNLTDAGLLMLRVMVGLIFALHGSQKIFGAFGGSGIEGFAQGLSSMGMPMPGLNAWLAALAEFGGGLALMLGALTRLACIPLTITMLVASFVAHGGKFFMQNGGMEYPLLLAVSAVAIGLMGPGRFSVDAAIKCKCLGGKGTGE